jgi:site-specific DNA recombinase
VEWIFLFPVARCSGEKMTSTSDSAEHPSEAKASPRPLRCAIYTRKSTEDGLNQPFNTLEAQREAAEAYILSQRHVGWTVVDEHYDDGGYTGGNLDRPALQKLLADMEAGLVDCVVIYKVDRLSRSLLDFARLMDVFERRGVNLVSVTQPLNTTVSMGRLTLNILLSFAQFEREIISERTRDKMAAARKKGKWMGGVPVLGYDVAPGGGRLVVNTQEAECVRAIFALYLEHRSVDQVLTAVQAQSCRNKHWTAETGTQHAGRPFTNAFGCSWPLLPVEGRPGSSSRRSCTLWGTAAWIRLLISLTNSGRLTRVVIKRPLPA